MGERVLSRDEYWKKKVSPFLRCCVFGGAGACMLIGMLTLLALGLYGLIDGAAMIFLGWGIGAKRSRACAVIAASYYAVNQLLVRLLPLGITAASGSMTLVYVFAGLMLMSIYGTFSVASGYEEEIAKQKAFERADDDSDFPEL